MAWDRKATAEDAWPSSPRARGAEEGQRAPTCCLPHARLLMPSPRTNSALALFLLEAGPDVEKLDLSSPGQRLLPCSQGTQRLAEPYSQELGTPSHPSAHSRLVRRKWALMRSGGGAREALVSWEAELTQGGPPHLPPAALLLAPKLRPELFFSPQPQRCCVPGALLPRERVCSDCFSLSPLSCLGFRNTLRCGGQAHLTHSFSPAEQAPSQPRRAGSERLGRGGETVTLQGCQARFSEMVVNPPQLEARCSGHFLKRSVGSALLFGWAAQYELLVPSPPHLPRSSF